MPGVASVSPSEIECSRHRLGKCLLLPTTSLPGHTEPKSLAFTGEWDNNIVKPTEKGKSKYALTLCLPINTQMFKSKRNISGAWSWISLTAKGICLLMPHGLHLSSFIHFMVVLVTCPPPSILAPCWFQQILTIAQDGVTFTPKQHRYFAGSGSQPAALWKPVIVWSLRRIHLPSQRAWCGNKRSLRD